MEQSLKSNLKEKFKSIASTAHTKLRPYFRFFLKQDFSENPVNLGLRIWF